MHAPVSIGGTVPDRTDGFFVGTHRSGPDLLVKTINRLAYLFSPI
jgi:hypothetical protein